MADGWILDRLDEPGLHRLAGLLALMVRPGDLLALEGDLGAGKTSFARAFIRAVLGDDDAEVPSPTFTLAQSYAGDRYSIVHLDLYRLTSADELTELGLDEALDTGVALVEWPERAAASLPPEHVSIRLVEDGAASRRVEITARGAAKGRIERARAIWCFLDTAEAGRWRTARLAYMQGDASPRSYARLVSGGHSAVLMNAPAMPDGPPVRDGRPYSRIAHLAEDVRPFVAIARELRRRGIAAPAIRSEDLGAGLLLIDDMGDLPFGRALGQGVSQETLWSAAVDVLVALRRSGPPGPMPVGTDGEMHHLPAFDIGALTIEIELLIDWYWLAAKGRPADEEARASFAAAWRPILTRLATMSEGWVLRDYHSPNLMWRPDRTGNDRVGVLDFQDAMAGPWAYDLVSLLQDARLDVPEALERRLGGRYVAAVKASGVPFDEEAHQFAYAALGAERNTKILGIFARLARRDGKPAYLAHIPRIWHYLERDLEHPALAPVKAWIDTHFPPGERTKGPPA